MVKKIVVFAMLNSYNRKENYVNSIILGMRKVRKSMMSWKKQGKTCVKRVLGGTMAAIVSSDWKLLYGGKCIRRSGEGTSYLQPKDIVEWRTFGDTGAYGRKYRQGWRTIDVRLCEISTECISERREQCIKYV